MTPPTVAAVRAWLQVPASVMPDEQLAQVIDAEATLQALACRVPDVDPGPSALVQAIYRRAGREVAARGVPLGMIGADNEYGPTRLSRWDSEVDRLEGPYRLVIFG